ncbi:hypothetical protein K9N68_29875 [Kovacikia minuta CCNUW1]|uniref:hypothetical protein n=1 Tax=Kovacikia minuta TaxID=2931930 RepID=UPI001CCB525D|nr:hypothetical protein [Kovacikia minuta]UBF25718.1 hypothetical protein K9N68_29875 [Kovacikia minuta CCNUW1]
MHARLKFSLEVVDGERLGKLTVPLSQVAEWINFLTSPHYGTRIIFAEQSNEGDTLYFDACEGLYRYLSDRIILETTTMHQKSIPLALAG